MYTSIQLLDMAKAMHGIPSDYALAKKMCISPASIYGIRNNGTSFGVDQCVTIAKLLDLDPMKILSCARIEQLTRMNNHKYIKMWEEYA